MNDVMDETVTRMLPTKAEFMQEYDLIEDDFLNAGLRWEDLVSIASDFISKQDKYENARKSFVDEYLSNSALQEYSKRTGRHVKIHSVRSRVKDPVHLMGKAIRKRKDKDSKYKTMTTDNYERFFTDLIGIRCLVVLKNDWCGVHEYLTDVIVDDDERYVRDCIKDFIDNEDVYHAEAPKVHIRSGDSREIYDRLLDPGYVEDGKIYRSAHYIIKYAGVYLEVQVRTLFEEGWGEVDHQIVYPPKRRRPDGEHDVLKDYSALLNRIAGLGDEMGAFFHELKGLAAEVGQVTGGGSSAGDRAGGVSADGDCGSSLHGGSQERAATVDVRPATAAECVLETIASNGKQARKGGYEHTER